MKGLFSLAAVVALTSATAINVNKRDSPLKVELTATGNSEVKVAVTNTGDKALNLLSKGTFLDEELPVEKVKMYTASTLTILLTILSILHLVSRTSYSGDVSFSTVRMRRSKVPL